MFRKENCVSLMISLEDFNYNNISCISLNSISPFYCIFFTNNYFKLTLLSISTYKSMAVQ